jgi:WhiB family redox-sensing transcriptional regulator
VKNPKPEPPLAAFRVEKQPWLLKRACADTPVEVFFDATEVTSKTERDEAVKVAKAICRSCPVRRDCLEQAMKEEGSAAAGRYGVRGYLTPQERRKLYRVGGLRGRDPVKLRLP